MTLKAFLSQHFQIFFFFFFLPENDSNVKKTLINNHEILVRDLSVVFNWPSRNIIIFTYLLDAVFSGSQVSVCEVNQPLMALRHLGTYCTSDSRHLLIPLTSNL